VGRFSEGTCLIAGARTSEHVYYLKTNVTRPGVRSQSSHSTVNSWVNVFSVASNVRVGADKSLARQGMKQATATKLGIYSTYSPRSSIHSLARCSDFCKPLKKKSRRLSVQPGLRGSVDRQRLWFM